LQLPHPRMTQRRFVLQPLADIRPDLVLTAEARTIAALLARLPAAPAVRLVANPW
jgi:2-amino-4-hydroxy-6-hydroxymethyldihydropteridine diphosphokinase